jgi:ABC-2 type transport system permease protein
MNGIVTSWLARIFDVTWLAGPIFDKELRVSSRRRRNYVLRFLYIFFFGLLLALVWEDAVSRGSSLYQSSRMAAAGLEIVVFVVWFQFIGAQVIAAVMLSTSISDEIYHRTLGVLMTTPIGAVQIVLGKLFSKLLQLLLLLAITLPLLAVVRVFGGVSWSYLVSCLCVTLTTVLFVGSLSLFFSIFTRRAYLVIIATILALGLLFALLPLVVAFLVYYPKEPSVAFVTVFCHSNPYAVMVLEMEALSGGRMPVTVSWPLHCGIMAGASALVLFLAMIVVRKVALRQAMGQTGLWSRRSSVEPQNGTRGAAVRRVVGPPVLWKERRALLGRHKIATILVMLAAVGLLLLTYELCQRAHMLKDQETHTAYVIIFTALGMLFTTVVPATCITTERESRTWPILLTTTVSDWNILSGKLLGVLWRCLPAWVLLFGHVLVFTLAGLIHPLALLQLVVLVAWILLFLASTGLYFSLRCRHTTTAVVANMALAAGVWGGMPLLLGIMVATLRGGEDLLKLCVDMNPFVHAGVIAAATSDHGRLASYSWMQAGISNATGATGWIVLNFLIYAAVASAFLLFARVRLRRNPF